MISVRPARLLPALVVFALATVAPAPDADACTRGPDQSQGFYGLSIASPVAPSDGGILLLGTAKDIAADRIATDLVVEAKAGERVVPVDVTVLATQSLGSGNVGFTLRILPKESLPADTKLSLELKSASTIEPSQFPLEATIGYERLADLDSLKLQLGESARSQIADDKQTATCVMGTEMMASSCGGGGALPERKFVPRFLWAHGAKFEVESSWRRTAVLSAYATVTIAVPSPVDSVSSKEGAVGSIATTATGRVCVDATITLKADPARKWTRQACLDLAQLPAPTATEQADFEERSLNGLGCTSIRYADGTTTTLGDAPSGSEDSGCSVGSHAGSSGTTSAFGALVALAMAGVARLRRRR